MSRPLDTSIDAYRRQVDAYRSMEPAERLRLAAEMSADVRALADSGIRRRHPDWTPDARAAELARILAIADSLDEAYIERWAPALGTKDAWHHLRDAARGAAQSARQGLGSDRRSE